MKKVFISAGHGGKDSGAVGNGLREKDLNLIYALSCANVLTEHGVLVTLSRTKDEDDPVQEEVNEANEQIYDIVVSFHTNAGGGDGFECFCNTGNKNGVRLGKLFEKYIKEIGQNSRGVKDGTHLYFIRKTRDTAVLCESAFIDNKKDVTIVDTKAKQEKVGLAYAKAILEYFGIPYENNNSSELYKVQVGAYKYRENAEKIAKELESKGYNTYIVKE